MDAEGLAGAPVETRFDLRCDGGGLTGVVINDAAQACALIDKRYGEQVIKLFEASEHGRASGVHRWSAEDRLDQPMPVALELNVSVFTRNDVLLSKGVNSFLSKPMISAMTTSSAPGTAWAISL